MDLTRYDKLRSAIRRTLSPDEAAAADRALEYAAEHTASQVRHDGSPMLDHAAEVARIGLEEIGLGGDSVVAAILHDVVRTASRQDEETFLRLTDEIRDRFGKEVLGMTVSLSHISDIRLKASREQAENFRELIVSYSEDPRVILIKLADRLEVMRRLEIFPREKWRKKSWESLNLYAQIAHKLGLYNIKSELEDIALRYLEPQDYQHIADKLAETESERRAFIARVLEPITQRLDQAGLRYHVKSRTKSIFSIWNKMHKQHVPFEGVYDIFAIRIIIDCPQEAEKQLCWTAYSVVTDFYTPNPKRMRDWISIPKSNGYESLHTTVSAEGRWVEVQIRTEEMHRQSEYGVAAHWRYKEKGGRGGNDSMDKQLAWLREMVDWQDETHDSREFLKDLKVDLAPTEVFVFTPKGEAMSLRAGSTPVDFAYAIHTEVGNHCVGAKVNGAIVPLAYELQLGDRVEILTQKSASPSRDWLNIVKTPSARNKIRAYFSKVTRADDLLSGRDKLAREMRKHGLGISNTRSERALRTVAEHLGYKDADDMLVNIGTSKESVQSVANRLLAELGRKGDQQPDPLNLGTAAMTTGKLPPMLTLVNKPKKHETKSFNGVVVEGVEGALVRLSRCCNPVPGDDIIGFVTRGRGVSVHRRDCPNAKELMAQPERIMKVHWESDLPKNTSFKVEVYIEALDRLQLLSDVVLVLSGMGANVLSSNTVSHRDGMAEMRFLFQVSDITHIDIILSKLKALEGVFDARRMVPKVGGGKDSALL